MFNSIFKVKANLRQRAPKVKGEKLCIAQPYNFFTEKNAKKKRDITSEAKLCPLLMKLY